MPRAAPRVRVLRAGEDLVDRSALDDLALVHHEHALARLADHGEVVGDEEQSRVAALHGREHEVEHLLLHGDVERGRGLIAHEQLGVVRQRNGEHHALTLTTRQLVRVGLRRFGGRGDADVLQQLQRAGVRGPAVALRAVHDHRLDDLRTHLHERVERGHRLLEHHRRARAPDAGELALPEVDEVALVAADVDGSLGAEVGGQQSHHGEGGERLARTGLADQADAFAALDVERQLRHERAVAGADGQVGHLDGATLDGRGGHGAGLQKRGHHRLLSLGSSRSRRPSPKRLNPSTAMAMAKPGKMMR